MSEMNRADIQEQERALIMAMLWMLRREAMRLRGAVRARERLNVTETSTTARTYREGQIDGLRDAADMIESTVAKGMQITDGEIVSKIRELETLHAAVDACGRGGVS